MKIVEIRDAVIPIASDIRNAYISFSRMTVSAVAVVSDVERRGRPLVGFGFHSNGRYAPQGVLRDRLIPRLLGADAKRLVDRDRENFDPFAAWHVMMSDEKPGGHGERAVAVGALGMALWDLAAKVEEKPLYGLLAERFNEGLADDSVWTYAAGGYYYPGKGIEGLLEEIRGYISEGYEAIKIKIGGASLAEDLERIDAVLELIGEQRRLAVDANGRFDRDVALQYAEALDERELLWFEEPGDPLDYKLNAQVARASRTPIATGENLLSFQDARNLIRYGGLERDRDYLQFDPALSYGLVEYMRILEMLEENGWSRRRCVPHGGHQFALHIAAGLGLGGNESYPGIFQPFGGFADNTPVEKGRVRLPDAPGVGVELKAPLMDVYRKLLA